MVALNGLLRPAVAAGSIAASLNTSSLNKRAGSISSGCGTTGALSCSSNAKGTCCFEAPGGLILQTQFWDTSPETGPTDSWTIHGLWPDNCDGSFSEDCDPSRDYTGISSLLTAQGASSTLSFMNQFWLNDPDDGSNEELWELQTIRATHGTCYSTLQTSCLPEGSPKGAEAVAFFEQVVTLFKTLPTYEWLTNQGIKPSSSTTHTYSALTAALEAEAGVIPALNCDGSDLDEIYWYFHLRGSVIDGEFEPISAPEKGDCPSSGIKWLPKN
ncbi:ribonuclease T2 [Lentinula edodes]|nr:ribonuclease T2 [Lentinula edodes]KAJ3890408.1 ribonuclease T2 [Lentinula edodes]KAJ3918539.1 ribonuclease T2 [Lentinula edodes]